jgi:hypothetical protein
MTIPYGIDDQFPTATCLAEIFVKLKSETPLVASPRRCRYRSANLAVDVACES